MYALLGRIRIGIPASDSPGNHSSYLTSTVALTPGLLRLIIS